MNEIAGPRGRFSKRITIILGALSLSEEGKSMDILHKRGNEPALAGHNLADEWTGFRICDNSTEGIG